MVRAIAGTLMQVGRGHWPPERVAEILAAGDRRVAGPTAPAAGLFLVRVYYPDELRLPRDPGDE
jgi:tRNA pseudouridine38-40 synthase